MDVPWASHRRWIVDPTLCECQSIEPRGGTVQENPNIMFGCWACDPNRNLNTNQHMFSLESQPLAQWDRSPLRDAQCTTWPNQLNTCATNAQPASSAEPPWKTPRSLTLGDPMRNLSSEPAPMKLQRLRVTSVNRIVAPLLFATISILCQLFRKPHCHLRSSLLEEVAWSQRPQHDLQRRSDGRLLLLANCTRHHQPN